MTTDRSNATPNSAHFITLQISDPAAFLNEIANRYRSTSRILMEYVDNALDDAEVMYRENTEKYPYPIDISVLIDRPNRSIAIRDNCRGMNGESLERIVANVGESRKKTVSWLNGRFGFGVHAFRACAKRIRFGSQIADGSALGLEFTRDDKQIPRPATSSPLGSAGTQVTLLEFDRDWLDDISIESVRSEIEKHFEILLARPNLQITVGEVGGAAVTCRSFDYATIDGTDFSRDLVIKGPIRESTVSVRLKVTKEPCAERRATFFAKGRRIIEVHQDQNFMRVSTRRTSLWAHPNLVGFIEVGTAVDPAITRDVFKRTKTRELLYEALLKLEDEINEVLHIVNQAQQQQDLRKVADLIERELARLAKEDRIRLRATPSAGTGAQSAPLGGSEAEEGFGGLTGSNGGNGGGGGSGDGDNTGPTNTGNGILPGEGDGNVGGGTDGVGAESGRRKKTGFSIEFVRWPAREGGTPIRSNLIDGAIMINSRHPQFEERVKNTRTGRMKMTDRLISYIAGTVSIHYKDAFYEKYRRQPDKRTQLFDDQLEFICRMEVALQGIKSEIQSMLDVSEKGDPESLIEVVETEYKEEA